MIDITCHIWHTALMYIDIVPNRDSPPAVLLRESYRDGNKVKKRTLANLSSLPAVQVEAIRQILKGHIPAADATSAFDILSSRHHGHVDAVQRTIKRLGLPRLLASRSSRERDLVLAMITARVLNPGSKLATARWWTSTTIPEVYAVDGATEDDLYLAMDWLFERQAAIETRLAGRHLTEGGMVLYDLTSSYFEGSTCPLAARGYSRDGKKGTLQVNFGLTTDPRGCPVSVRVFEGNTADPATLMHAVRRVRDDFGINHIVFVGDRGMITQRQINEIRPLEDVDWITAMRSEGLQKLLKGGELQMGLFDERDLFEIRSDAYPGERLVACRNPALAKRRRLKRQSMLDATQKELEKVQGMVRSGKLVGQDRIGLRVGKVINKHKMGKHFELTLADDDFSFTINDTKVQDEAALDGVYVVRTSLPAEAMTSDDVVRNYKRLCQVERAFRSIKTMDLHVRPIHHRLAERVKAHIFLCMLAYYVRWHMEQALRPLLFNDEDTHTKAHRDPVAPARRSAAALEKVARRTTEEGFPVHSFQTLLAELSTIVRNTCCRQGVSPAEVTFDVDTSPNPLQHKAFELLAAITLPSV